MHIYLGASKKNYGQVGDGGVLNTRMQCMKNIPPFICRQKAFDGNAIFYDVLAVCIFKRHSNEREREYGKLLKIGPFFAAFFLYSAFSYDSFRVAHGIGELENGVCTRVSV